MMARGGDRASFRNDGRATKGSWGLVFLHIKLFTIPGLIIWI